MALYGPRANRWALTERGRDAVHREAATLAIGPSDITWRGDCLEFRLDEIASPLPSPIRGTVRIHPRSLAGHVAPLDAMRRHAWRPLAPSARVEVDLTHPDLRWCGEGYVDSNAGDEPLEDAFTGWSWSRASIAEGTSVLYDVRRRDGTPLTLSLAFDRSGEARTVPAPPLARLPGTRWGIARETRADAHCQPSVLRTLEDTPFYARSLLDTRLLGTATTAMHESLSLERFRRAWVRALLPFRLPRPPRWLSRSTRQCR